MKKQLITLSLFTLGAHALKADRYHTIFEKPYRQEAALALGSTMLIGGGYYLAKSMIQKRPVRTLLSLGAASAGVLSILIAEGNSAQPKLITNENFPSLAHSSPETQPELAPHPHAAFETLCNACRFDKAVDACVHGFDSVVSTVEEVIKKLTSDKQ